MTRLTAAHPALVLALMLVLTYPLPGPYGLAGLVLLGAVPAALHHRWRLRRPAVVALLGAAAAITIELVVPGPTIAALDWDMPPQPAGWARVTTGIPVLERYVATWPLLLALCLVAAGLERADRSGWARSLGRATVAAVTITALVGLAGLQRGWASAPPVAVLYGLPYLLVLALLAALLLFRFRLVTPAIVLGTALALGAVAYWVQPVGDAVTGMVASTFLYLTLALLLAGTEALLRRVRRRKPVPA